MVAGGEGIRRPFVPTAKVRARCFRTGRRPVPVVRSSRRHALVTPPENRASNHGPSSERSPWNLPADGEGRLRCSTAFVLPGGGCRLGGVGPGMGCMPGDVGARGCVTRRSGRRNRAGTRGLPRRCMGGERRFPGLSGRKRSLGPRPRGVDGRSGAGIVWSRLFEERQNPTRMIGSDHGQLPVSRRRCRRATGQTASRCGQTRRSGSRFRASGRW